MQDNTNQQYDRVVERCKEIFIKKTRDYGTSWRVYRTISVIDQIYIKAKRIRTIQEKGSQKVADDLESEFIGMVNYALIGLIQLDLSEDDSEELELPVAEKLYHEKVAECKVLMQQKNHDYGEAWRDMSQESFVDLILAKLQRIRQILVNKGKTIASEGIDANFHDIVNYGIFAQITR